MLNTRQILFIKNKIENISMKALKLDFINAKSYIIGLGETLTHWGTVVLKWTIHDNCVCMFYLLPEKLSLYHYD